ncbi:MAG: ATP-dependent DNA helicase RecG [Planctomycetota bacterium]
MARTQQVTHGVDDPATVLRGVGERRALLLRRIGVETVGDLLALQPRRVETRGPVVPVGELAEHEGSWVQVNVRVRGVAFVRKGRGRSLVRVSLEDRDAPAGKGARTEALYFNQPYLRNAFEKGREVELYGRVVRAPGVALAAPRLVRDDDPPPGSLELTYPLTEGLGQNVLRSIVLRAVELTAPSVVDPLPREVLGRLELPPLGVALVATHRPNDRDALRAGLRRLRLDSALEFQARLAARRRARERGSAPACRAGAEVRGAVLSALPFEPTAAQRRVMDELAHDLARRAPMRRLLQGDVGAGKTVCALFAVAVAARAGHQAAVLAPTEVLAEQHFATERERLERLGVRAALLTGSTNARTRRKVHAQLAAGELDAVFGTHALLSDDLRFASLALAVVDEQHRFGVLQRERLFAKGRDVHQLLMTATPIPRTLAQTLWADLDVSVLDEKPPGREPSRTFVLGHDDLPRVLAHVAARVETGESLFWIAPRIESAAGARGAEEIAAALSRSPLGARGVALVHGEVPTAERLRRLAAFRDGEAATLVGTTVLEVGIDVPRATCIVVEGAERLGTAQIHQLRGRVGRGGGTSWCFLLANEAGRDRLRFLERTDDGFEVAERDLATRGMGDLLGERQTGANAEGLGDGEPDLELWLAARDLVATSPELRELYAARAESRR